MALAERIEIKNTKLGELDGEIVWNQSEGEKNSFGVKFKEMPNDKYSKVIKYISDSSNGYHEDE